MKLNKCRSCGGIDFTKILDFGEQPWCNDLIDNPKEEFREYPLHLGWCDQCTLLQLNYTVAKETMFTKHAYVSGTTKTLREHFEKLAKDNMLDLQIYPEDPIVDIGGNDGTQLLAYKDLGLWNVTNVESASNIAELSVKAGVPTINKFFNLETVKESFKENSVKLLNAAGVFFHLEELHSVIDGINFILREEDGVFVIQCMYAGSMIENNTFDMVYHEHLCYYTLQSLTTLLQLHGLRVFDVEHSPIHSGSLIVKACKKGSKYEVRESVIKFMAEESEVCTKENFLKFAKGVEESRVEFISLIKELKAKGRSIYAYGAPAKGNTLLNYYGLTNKEIDKAVEINPMKIGKILPKSNIPIVLEDKEDAPDVYLLLSHNFEDEIIAKNQDIMEQGTQFLIPFPEIRLRRLTNV